MRKCILTAVLALGLMSPQLLYAQQTSTGAEQLIDEGLELYRNDHNEEALSRFQQALKLKPDDFRALYGTALVYYTTGRYAESAALCEQLVKRGDGKIPNLYVTYGTSLDRQQKSAEAVQVYQQAIQKFPADEPLRRYQGIALQNLKRYPEASASFQQALRLDPRHASTSVLLAQAEAMQGHRVQALMACMHGLMFENVPERAARTCGLLDKLLQAGVQQTGGKNVTINIRESAMKQSTSHEAKPDDFAKADVALSLESALDFSEKEKDKTPAARLVDKLNILCSSLSEQRAGQRLGFNWEFYAPFFMELQRQGHTEALAYVLQAMHLDASPDVQQWLKQHPQQLSRLVTWVKAYEWPK